jgi:hypothetical protein
VSVTFTRAAPADETALREMMQAFYAGERLRFDPACAAALRELLENPAWASSPSSAATDRSPATPC